MTRADRTPPAPAGRLSTAQVGAVLTALARAASTADDRAAVVALRDCQLWLNTTTALARAAERRQLVRCPSCREPLPELGELHDLLHRLAVEL